MMKNSKHLFGLSLLLALVLSGCNNGIIPSSEQPSASEPSSESTSAYEGDDTSDASEPVSSEPVSSDPSSSEEVVAEWPDAMQQDMMNVLGEVLLAYPLSDLYEYYGYEEDYAYNIGDYDPSMTDDEYAELLAPTLGDEWTDIAYDDEKGMYYAEKEWDAEDGALAEGAIWFYTVSDSEGQAFFFHFDGIIRTPVDCLEDWPEEAKSFMTTTFGELLPFSQDTFPEAGFFTYNNGTLRFEALVDSDEEPFVENYAYALLEEEYDVEAESSYSVSATKDATVKVTLGEEEYDAYISIEFGFDYDEDYNDIFYLEASLEMEVQFVTAFPEDALEAFLGDDDFVLSTEELKEIVSPMVLDETTSAFIWQVNDGQFQLAGSSTLEKLDLEGLESKFFAKEYGFSVSVYAESDEDDIEVNEAITRDGEEPVGGEEEPTLSTTYVAYFVALTGEYSGYIMFEDATGMFVLTIKKSESLVDYSATLPEAFTSFETVFPAVPTLGEEFGYAYTYGEEEDYSFFQLAVVDDGTVLEAYLTTLGQDGYELELDELYYLFFGLEYYSYYDYFGGHGIEVMYEYGILTVIYIEFEPVTGVDFTADLSSYFYDEPTDEEAIFDFGAFYLDIEQGESTIGVGNMSAAGEDTPFKFLFGTKDGLRFYKGQTMTFTFSDENPSQIVFTCVSGKNNLSVTEGGTGSKSGATYTVDVDPEAEQIVLGTTDQSRILGIEFVF